MGQGIKFFDEDFAEQPKGGSVTVSSGAATQWFAFDYDKMTFWVTSGEDTDGNAVEIIRDLGSSRTIDTIYVYNTNIDNIAYAYFNGTSWVAITSSNATITKTSDGMYIHIKLNSSVSTRYVRLTGSNTITANQEKKVGLFIVSLQLGQFEYFPTIVGEYGLDQITKKLDSSKMFIIEKGETFSAVLEMKSHVNQNDIDLIESIIARKKPFFIWICGGDTSQFTYLFRPYRFEDIFKVGIVGNLSPNLTRNYYKAGYNNTINMVELA